MYNESPWRQWSINEAENNALLYKNVNKASEEHPIELRSYSVSRIQNPNLKNSLITSTTNLLNTNEESSNNSINIYDNHTPNCLIIPSSTSCGFNKLSSCDSPITRRFSDSLYSTGGIHNSNNSSLKYENPMMNTNDNDEFQYNFKNSKSTNDNFNYSHKPLHYRSHNVISHSRGLGIDEIGLDFMRANGAIPGFRQLHQPLSKSNEKKCSVVSLIANIQNNTFKDLLNHHNHCHSSQSPSESHSTGINKSISCNIIHQSDSNHNNNNNQSNTHRLNSLNNSCSSSSKDFIRFSTSHKSDGSSYHGNVKKKISRVSIAERKSSHAVTPTPKYQTQRSMKSVGYRLGRRKELCEKRMRISDFSLSFAIFGILVMVIDTELLWAGVYKKTSSYSIFLKSLITISTIILLGLILAYHALVIQIELFSYDDSIEDWKIAINGTNVAQLLLELLICSIHPAPGLNNISVYLTSWWSGREMEQDNKDFMPESKILAEDRLENLADPLLALPMLLRLYMIFRSLLLHSRMFRDAGSRSIGAMNKVNFNTRFILKTLMTICPGTMLLTFILSFWILQSWGMRMCEINSGYPHHSKMLNSMWLIAVTFLSIGYGDIVPHTNCGRGIAVCSGLMGSACTALLVAVFARKLELTKAEKHVTQFMLENQLTKKLKYYAANVLRETWLIYKYTKLVKQVNASRVRSHQRKFLTAIHGLRKLKIDQRKFKDNSNTLVDLAKTQSNIYETVTEMRLEHSCLDNRINTIEANLKSLQEQLTSLPSLLSNILSEKSNNQNTNISATLMSST